MHGSLRETWAVQQKGMSRLGRHRQPEFPSVKSSGRATSSDGGGSRPRSGSPFTRHCGPADGRGRREGTRSHPAGPLRNSRAHTALAWVRENQDETHSTPRACLCNPPGPGSAWRPGSERTAQTLQKSCGVRSCAWSPGYSGVLYRLRRGPVTSPCLLDARPPNKQWTSRATGPPASPPCKEMSCLALCLLIGNQV